ncbi:MAG: hypothetical protein QXY45_04495 [Candidatus Aenigmatarchaeota archaeon]
MKGDKRQKELFFFQRIKMEVGMAREGYWNNEKFTEFVSVLALEYKRRGYKRDDTCYG